MPSVRARPAAPASPVERLSMAGWSHHGTPLALLEQLALPRSERPHLLAALRDAGCPEAVVLSTCSRTEVYAAGGRAAAGALVPTVAELVGLPVSRLTATVERRGGGDVVDHLFLVTAGLRSRVVGEAEIRMQVRSAVKQSRTAGAALPTLGPLFAAAARSATRVHERTGLGARARSLGRRAVDVGLECVRDVDDPVVLVVGGGHMARTAVEHLQSLGRRPHVSARSAAQATRLVGAGSTCPLPALADGVAQADLLLCATSASHDVVTVDHVRQAMAARSRRLVVVDLSVPRNVDVGIAGIPGVRLLDVEGLDDDLSADDALATALVTGRTLAHEQARAYVDALSARAAGPVIAALRSTVEDLCLRELTRVAARDVDPQLLTRAARAITGKLLHSPTMTARAAAARGDAAVLDVLDRLFDDPVRSSP